MKVLFMFKMALITSVVLTIFSVIDKQKNVDAFLNGEVLDCGIKVDNDSFNLNASTTDYNVVKKDGTIIINLKRCSR